VLRVFGGGLRKVLADSVSNRFHAFLAGLGVTALVQSSSATALIASSFVSQNLMGLAPALAIMLAMRRPPTGALRGGAVALAAAVLVASPFLLRNLRLFGVPFHSDVGAYGIWPYVDHLTFSHGLERPPAPIAFAFAHLPEVLRHMVASAATFVVFVMPRDIVGNPVWVPALAVGHRRHEEPRHR